MDKNWLLISSTDYDFPKLYIVSFGDICLLFFTKWNLSVIFIWVSEHSTVSSLVVDVVEIIFSNLEKYFQFDQRERFTKSRCLLHNKPRGSEAPAYFSLESFKILKSTYTKLGIQRAPSSSKSVFSRDSVKYPNTLNIFPSLQLKMLCKIIVRAPRENLAMFHN